ncbi:MAG TPA: methylisocitrate lyase [Kiritimatiellia bacterium]|nr:methylisocitrate lyase [Kiritimatiellia bacterium]
MTNTGQFKAALAAETPLQIAGVINAYAAKLAERAGFRALYVSGAGVANASFGLPDLGFTTREQVAEDVRRIAGATSLPLVVDVDTGWDDPAETARAMAAVGAAVLQMEDQVDMKRCGHRPNKQLVSTDEMCTRIRAMASARPGVDVLILARTDAAAGEGVAAAVARAKAYVAAGADYIFAEALRTLDDYRAFTSAVSVPVLANITEFGRTPLFTTAELAGAGVRMALYPLSAFRAMSRAAENVFAAIRNEGTQQSALGMMQSREELYDVLDYHRYEREADERLKKK